MTSLPQGEAGPQGPAAAVPSPRRACSGQPGGKLGRRAPWSFAALCAALAVGCSHEAPKSLGKPVASSTPTPVSVTSVVQKPWPKTVRVQGSLFADQETIVAAKVAGRVSRVLVDIGSEVRQGQLVGELETLEFELRVKLAEAQLAQARSALGLAPSEPDSSLDRLKAPPVVLERSLVEEAQSALERTQTLYDRKVTSVEELEQKKAILAVARSRYQSALNAVDEKIALIRVRRVELEVAKQTLIDAEMRAPYDGVVQARTVNDGSYVRIGEPLVTLVRTNPLRFRASVPERQAKIVIPGKETKLIQPGQQVEIFVEGIPNRIEAVVARTSPMLDLASRSLTIEADVPNPMGKLRPGWFAEADLIVVPDASAVAVSPKALSEFAGVEKVFLVRDGVSKEQRVVTGRRRGDLVEIMSGLKAGDKVVEDGSAGVVGKVVVKDAPQLVAQPPAGEATVAPPQGKPPAPAGTSEAIAKDPAAEAAHGKQNAASGE